MASRFALPPLLYRPQATDHTLEILRLLVASERYDLLPSNWFPPFLGTSLRVVRRKLQDMTQAGLVERFTMNGSRNPNETMKYRLTAVGECFLMEHGHPVATFNRKKVWTKHQLLGCLIHASLELGTRETPGYSLIGPTEILNHRYCPQETKTSEYPFTFHTGSKRLTPDGKPLVIRTPAGAKLLLREDDRHTEQISSSDYATTIHEKLQNWQIVFKNRLFYKKYGIESAVLLFTTVNDKHKENIKAQVVKTIGSPSWFCIKSMPLFKDPTTTIEPTTVLFHEPWERIGHPLLSLK